MQTPNHKKKQIELLKLVIACGLGGVLLVLLLIPSEREPADQDRVKAAFECPPDPIVEEAMSPHRESTRQSVSHTSPLDHVELVSQQRTEPQEVAPREVDIQSIIAHNPFSDGANATKILVSTTSRGEAANVPNAVTSRSDDNESLPPTISVAAIITGGNKPAALIGQQLYSVDDYLHDGWQIVAITSDGIRVRRSR